MHGMNDTVYNRLITFSGFSARDSKTKICLSLITFHPDIRNLLIGLSYGLLCRFVWHFYIYSENLGAITCNKEQKRQNLFQVPH